MTNFIVTFQLKSFYDDEKYNKVAIIKKSYQTESIDDVYEMLEDTDEIESIDDQLVINEHINDEPYEINIEYVLIHGSDGKELYRDKDYTDF